MMIQVDSANVTLIHGQVMSLAWLSIHADDAMCTMSGSSQAITNAIDTGYAQCFVLGSVSMSV